MSPENCTFSPDPKAPREKQKTILSRMGTCHLCMSSLHTVYKADIFYIIVQAPSEVKDFLEFLKEAAGGSEEAVQTQFSGFQTQGQPQKLGDIQNRDSHFVKSGD
jgi:hypothetical protein